MEKFVVRLEEKIELLVQCCYNIEGTDFSTFDKLHPLIRSDSLERKCEECNYVARNEAKLDKHKEIKHVHTCNICKNTAQEYHGDNIFKTHNDFVHLNGDKAFIDEEFILLETDKQLEIERGPETIRKASFIEKIKNRKEKKQKEEERMKRREKI